MIKRHLAHAASVFCLFLLGQPTASAQQVALAPQAQSTDSLIARGTVFLDQDGDQMLDENELGMAGVGVSNGRTIVTTDEQGKYEIEVSDDTIIFVLKPQNFSTPMDRNHQPKFYYIHKPAGSPESRFPGVAPTGPLPETINFPLYPQDEPELFRAVLFGDPQPRDQAEIDFIAHDVVEELVGVDAALGITLGDILFDDLSLFESQSTTIGLIGIPWYNVIGNHDINREANSRQYINETFERHFGPSYYSFDHGPVHFVVLDDIDWVVPADGSAKDYRAGLGEQQLEFVANDLARVADDRLVVFLMHIPLTQIVDREAFYRLIETRKFCLSISGHTHHHEHRFITEEDGWRGAEPHHHIINVTVSGSWWTGELDDRGIPHTTMADGGPNGYSIMTFDGTEYRLDYKAAGRPADYQMRITVPDEIPAGQATTVWINVFDGSERTKVEMRTGSSAEWIEMQRSVEIDPAYAELYARDQKLTDRARPAIPKPKPSTHLWKAELAGDLPLGAQLIHVRATDPHGRVFEACRVIRVVAPAATAEATSNASQN